MHLPGCMDWSVPISLWVVYLLSILNIQSSYGVTDQKTLEITIKQYMKPYEGMNFIPETLHDLRLAISKNKRLSRKHDLSNEEIKTSNKAKKMNTELLKKLQKYQKHKKAFVQHALKVKANLEKYLAQNTFEAKIVGDTQRLIRVLDMFSTNYDFVDEIDFLEGVNEYLDVNNKGFLSVVLNKTNNQRAFKAVSKIRKRVAAVLDAGSSLRSEPVVIATLTFKQSNVKKVGVKLIVDAYSKNTENYGGLMVYEFGTWFHLCDSGWNDKASQVVCRELGYDPTRAITIKSANMRPEFTISGSIQCQGNETHLSECNQEELKLRTQFCKPNNYVSIACVDKPMIKTRLADGNSLSGRPEVFYKGNWANLCTTDTRIDNLEVFAYLTCENSGFKARHAFAVPYSQFGKGTSSVSVELDCPLTFYYFPTLQLCTLYEVESCGHVSVFCFEKEPKIDVFVKCLSLGGHWTGHGLVRFCEEFENAEILRWNGRSFNPFVNFGTVCGNNFGIEEAQVVCRQSGFNPADAALNTFGWYDECIEGGDDIKMSDVQCYGDEKNLAECSLNYGENVTCPGNKRASLFCTPVYVRRDNDQSLQMFVNEDWRRICATNWGDEEAKVVCRQLGKPHDNASGYAVPGNAHNAWITNVNCQGDERHIGQCDYIADFSMDLLTDDDYCLHWNRFHPGITEYLDYDFNNCNNDGYAAINCQ